MLEMWIMFKITFKIVLFGKVPRNNDRYYNRKKRVEVFFLFFATEAKCWATLHRNRKSERADNLDYSLKQIYKESFYNIQFQRIPYDR